MVEQRTENPCVGGSSPPLDEYFISVTGCVAQLVEHLAFNLMVVGSNPAIPKIRKLLTTKRRDG